MTISEYKEATVKLREFVRWSKDNYTRTPKIALIRAKKIAQTMPFYPDRLTRALQQIMMNKK